MEAASPAPIGGKRWLARIGILAAVTAVLEILSLRLAIPVPPPTGPGPAPIPYTVVWPASAVLLWAFLRYGISLWPAILIGNVALPFVTQFDWTDTIATTAADVGSLVPAAWCLRRMIKGNNPLRRVGDFATFLVVGGIGASILGTIIGLGTASLFRPLKGPLFELLGGWGFESVMSMVVFVPPLWIEWRERSRSGAAAARAEIAALFVYVSAVGYFAFLHSVESESWQKAFPLMMVPGIIWGAIRWRQKGAAAVLLYGCVLAVAGALRRTGAFATDPIQAGLTGLQTFMGVMAVTGFLIAAALDESSQSRLAVAETEGKYRDLVETSTDLIWSVDALGRFTFVNQASEPIFGYKPEEMLGKPFTDFYFSEEQKAKDLATFATLKAGRPLHRYETIQRRKDGNPVVVSANGIVLRDPQGNVIGATGTSTDITAIIRAQEQVKASEARFRSIFEYSPIGIYIGRRGRPLFVNHALVRMFGFATMDEALSKAAVELVAPEEREALQRLAQRRESGLPAEKSYEIQGMRLDGTRFPLAVLVDRIPLPEGDAVVAFLTDLTERKTLEEQLRQSQKMEAVGRLAGGVAHDFNNLLTVILGYCDVLRESLPKNDPLYKGVVEIWRAGDRAAALTQQLLAFARRQVVRPGPLIIDLRVRSTVDMLRRIIGEDVELVTRFAPDLRATRIDPTQLDQLLMNLVVNARDAMPAGGRLTISTENVTVATEEGRLHEAARPGEYVLLSVTDTGVGMDSETRSHLFEPFFTTKGNGKGTGLGMATVYGIVQQCGGQIAVDTEPGRGTTFRIYFPPVPEALPTEAPAPASPAAVAPAAAGRATILLVEDEEIVRGLARHTLERQGYTVLEAASGAQAVSICGSHATPIDLVLTDVVMPQMSGPDLAKRLATLVPHAKILYMSGYTEGQTLQVGLAKSDAPLLAKPFTPTQLVEKVREVLAARPA